MPVKPSAMVSSEEIALWEVSWYFIPSRSGCRCRVGTSKEKIPWDVRPIRLMFLCICVLLSEIVPQMVTCQPGGLQSTGGSKVQKTAVQKAAHVFGNAALQWPVGCCSPTVMVENVMCPSLRVI